MKKRYTYEVQQKAERFLGCRQMEDLAQLGFDTNQLLYQAMHPRYYTFELRKKSGGFRSIEAPDHALKAIQRQFNAYLQCVYFTQQSPAAYAYIIRVRDQVDRKNILENARVHLGAIDMLNVDFAGFFHQISDQRIFRLLQKAPFQFEAKTALALVKLFTYKKRLPMGAPTSPVLSNMVALELDQTLLDWAKVNGIRYTRFVDDLTFSSKEVTILPIHYEAIRDICAAHQLKLNPTKTKYYGKEDTKKVTGLILKDTVDIEPEFYQQLNHDLKRLKHTAEVNLIVNKHQQDQVLKAFQQQVEGQINFIGMIEGYGSPEFCQYRQKLKAALNPSEESLSLRWTHFHYF